MLIDTVDMNLLRPLRALLEERSVSRAAARLHVSQPTVSVALARLRRHFDDPLLVRSGSGYRLSPLAVRLQDSVVAALRASDRVFTAQSSFDASASRREFVLYGTDFATSTVGGPLTRILERDAPHVVVRFESVTTEMVNGAPASLRECDGMFLPYGYIDDCPHIDVIADRWVCLLAADNESVGSQPSAAELLSLQWISTLDGKHAGTPALLQMQLAGSAITIAVVTPNFFVIPSLLVGTQRAALVQESFARTVVASFGGVRMVEPPFGLEPIREALWWHPDREDEPEHMWLRRRVAEAVGARGLSQDYET